MRSLPPPQEFLKQLQQSDLFKEWKKPESYLSHFFCAVSGELKAKTNWEVGFFNKEHNKITVFTSPKEGSFAIKPEDDVFKKEQEVVEELDITTVTKTVDEAADIFIAKKKELFPNEEVGDGFIVIQTLEGKPLWNFTFITKSLKFINIKINASSGDVESHQAVELVQK